MKKTEAGILKLNVCSDPPASRSPPAPVLSKRKSRLDIPVSTRVLRKRSLFVDTKEENESQNNSGPLRKRRRTESTVQLEEPKKPVRQSTEEKPASAKKVKVQPKKVNKTAAFKVPARQIKKESKSAANKRTMKQLAKEEALLKAKTIELKKCNRLLRNLLKLKIEMVYLLKCLLHQMHMNQGLSTERPPRRPVFPPEPTTRCSCRNRCQGACTGCKAKGQECNSNCRCKGNCLNPVFNIDPIIFQSDEPNPSRRAGK